MTRVRFGGFLAPHHPIGENPTLQFRRDLDLAEHLDRHVIEHRDVFERAGQAVMSKIMANERAAKALAESVPGDAALHAHNAPDLDTARNGSNDERGADS